MEIPTYYSKVDGPGTTGLPTPGAGIVNYGDTLAGAHRLEAGLYQLGQDEARAEMSKQVELAGQYITQTIGQLDTDMQALREKQGQAPIDPWERVHEARWAVNAIQNRLMDDPELAKNPQARQYIAAHLQPLLKQRLDGFTKEMSGQAKDWGVFQSEGTIRGYMMNRDLPGLKAYLAGKIWAGVYTDKEAIAKYHEAENVVAFNDTERHVMMNAQGWVEARERGELPTWFNREHPWTNAQMNHFDDKAQHVIDEQAKRAKAEDAAYTDRIKKQGELVRADLIAEAVILDDKRGISQPERIRQLMVEASQSHALRLSGHLDDTLLTLNNLLGIAEKGKGNDSQFKALLRNVYDGRYANESKVIQAGAGMGVNGDEINRLVGAWHTWKQTITQTVQDEYHAALDYIKRRTQLPGGSTIDPLGLTQIQASAIDALNARYQSLIDEVPTKGPAILKSTQWATLAYDTMQPFEDAIAQNSIQILDSFKHLKYKTPTEVELAYRSHEISQREMNAALKNLEIIQVIQQVEANRKLTQGRNTGTARVEKP